MYDYEYPYDIEYSSHDYLDENYAHTYVHNTYDLDDDYQRDSTDYQALAYIHYA